jgi:hypothetical protein
VLNDISIVTLLFEAAKANLPCSPMLDPKYEEEVSGCTACVGLIAGNKLYVVSSPATLISHAASLFRKHYRGRRTVYFDTS